VVFIRTNRSEIARLLRSDQFRPALRQIAEEKADRARSTAPVDSGEYKGSIDVESDTTDRAAERVVAHARHAAVVEAKTGNLKRALGG